MIGNFMRWVRHVGLPRFVRDDSSEEGPMLTLASFTLSVWDFASAEEGALWLLNAQLHRLMLYLLLWGEAANVRHLPEGMAKLASLKVLQLINCHALDDSDLKHLPGSTKILRTREEKSEYEAALAAKAEASA